MFVLFLYLATDTQIKGYLPDTIVIKSWKLNFLLNVTTQSQNEQNLQAEKVIPSKR